MVTPNAAGGPRAAVIGWRHPEPGPGKSSHGASRLVKGQVDPSPPGIHRNEPIKGPIGRDRIAGGLDGVVERFFSESTDRNRLIHACTGERNGAATACRGCRGRRAGKTPNVARVKSSSR